MTLRTLLREMQPAPPARLVDRMSNAAVDSAQASADPVEGARIASLYLLRIILADKNVSRSAALDLLAADALMTCACEAACDHPESVVQAADASIEAVLAAHRGARDMAKASD